VRRRLKRRRRLSGPRGSCRSEVRRRSRPLQTEGKLLGFNSEEEKRAERIKRELQERSAQAQQAAADRR
jgi:hypothetical protein